MGERGGLPCPFLKTEKSVQKRFRKKYPTVCIYRLSFSFNLSFSILRVSRSQNSNIFTCEATFLCVARQIFIEMHWFQLFFTFSINNNKQSVCFLLTSALLQFHALILFNEKTCCPKQQGAKGLNHWFSFLFFYQKVKRGFQFFNM